MPLFDSPAPVAAEAVAAGIAEHWGLVLGARLKASQNTTFEATKAADAPAATPDAAAAGVAAVAAAADTAASSPTTTAPITTKYAVRVTRDPKREQEARIRAEVGAVSYLAAATPPGLVCAPVPTRAGEPLARLGDEYIVVVYEWAAGTAVDFGAYRWMTVPGIITSWGAAMAHLHAAARAYAAARPDAARAIRPWDELHDGVMRGVVLSPEDAAVAAAGLSDAFIVSHGDLNLSNFFITEPPTGSGSDTTTRLSIYDWDQVQRGWPEYDMAQSALTVFMLAEGGSLPAGEPVPGADPAAWLAAFIGGYEGVAGVGAVNRARLARMVELRKLFYGRFGERATAEGGVPDDMAWFIAHIDRWMNASGRSAAAAAAVAGVGDMPAATAAACGV